MTLIITTIAFVFAILSIVLGFIALLRQKTYLDASTHETVIDVPLVGKLQTNYPALAFVFLGFVLAIIAFEKALPPRKVAWHVEGMLVNPEKTKFDWQDGSLTVTPADLRIAVSEQGRFTLDAAIEEGKSFADACESLDFSHPAGSAQIADLKRELARFQHGQPSLIASATAHTLTLKPVPLTLYAKEP